MSKFIKSVTFFVLFCAVFYVIFLCVWGDVVPIKLNKNIKYKIGGRGHLYSRINEIKNFENVDILFLGSSNCYRGFDVRLYEQLGLKVFNLGSSAQSPIQTKILLERYLNTLNPKIIIYAVPSFYSDGVESSLYLIANDKKDFSLFKMILKIKNLKTFNTGIYGFYRSIFDKDKGYKENVIKGKDRYVSGGFVESEINYYSSESDKKNTKDDIKKEKRIKYQVSAFEEIIHEINKRKIELILVNPPVTQNNYKENIEDECYFKNKASYYNFNNNDSLLILNDSLHFYDAFHLNQKGVELFNKKLIKILNLKEIIENKRE